ncbi:MAG: EpsI family protein [Acidobacteriota bacterium]|nr:EpsI family protein [Acidobacteriota bacterium]
MKSFLQSKFVYALTAVLVVQAALFYSASRGETPTNVAPLSEFPAAVGNWHLIQEGVIDKESQDVLKADDLLTRDYGSTGGDANLFIAFFKTQRNGQSPHSPKNCLPGSGWQQEETGRIDVPVNGGTIRINQYVVSKGGAQSVVDYWYQSQGRVIADEFAAKFYLISDSIRNHRSDTALVRVVVPIRAGKTEEAEKLGTQFVQEFFPVVKSRLPL